MKETTIQGAMQVSLNEKSNYAKRHPSNEERTNGIYRNEVIFLKRSNQHGFKHMMKIMIENELITAAEFSLLYSIHKLRPGIIEFEVEPEVGHPETCVC